MNSIWFKLWLYHKLQCGPQTILLTRGTRLTKLPKPFKVRYSYLRYYFYYDNVELS